MKHKHNLQNTNYKTQNGKINLFENLRKD